MHKPVEVKDGALRFLRGTPRDKEKDAALAVVERHAYDDVIPHEELAGAMGVNRTDKQGAAIYNSVMQAVKRRALARLDKFLRAMPGVGYRILPAVEQIRESASYSKKAARNLRRGAMTAAHTDVSQLSDAELATKTHLQNNFALLAARMATESRALVHVAQTNALPYSHEVSQLPTA